MFSTAWGENRKGGEMVCLGRLVGEIEINKEKIYPQEIIDFFPSAYVKSEVKLKRRGGHQREK